MTPRQRHLIVALAHLAKAAVRALQEADAPELCDRAYTLTNDVLGALSGRDQALPTVPPNRVFVGERQVSPVEA